MQKNGADEWMTTILIAVFILFHIFQLPEKKTKQTNDLFYWMNHAILIEFSFVGLNVDKSSETHSWQSNWSIGSHIGACKSVFFLKIKSKKKFLWPDWIKWF